ncbi:hypothetical protein [Halorientalis sp.]|nr:hypothetical protein [Halorientalis sp.]
MKSAVAATEQRERDPVDAGEGHGESTGIGGKRRERESVPRDEE